MEFQRAGVFRQPARDASATLPDQVSEKVKAERQAKIMASGVDPPAAQRRPSADHPSPVDGVSEERSLLQGSMSQAPEIDGITYINDGWPTGRLVELTIEEVHDYDLVGGIQRIVRRRRRSQPSGA